jgi:hypothetical protein
MVREIRSEPTIRQTWTGPSQRVSVGLVARPAALIAGPALLIGVLAWPLLFTESIFNEDWINHLWFIWHQSLAIREDHVPSLFLNYAHAVFYPQYAFYGGTVDALAGGLSLLLGNAPLEAYVLTYLIAFAASYGGWYWMARMAGVGRWWAHAPGLVFVTSAYYITSIYARGGWPEVMAVSAMPLMMAAGLSVLRAEHARLWPALALIGSAVIFFGSHNITMLWGSTTLVAAASLILLFVPRARRELTRRGVLRVAALVVPAALVSAWFLLPAVAYMSQTLIGGPLSNAQELLSSTMGLVSVAHLFTISRASATEPNTPFALSLPILEIAWVLVSIAILLASRAKGVWMRMLLLVSALTTAITILMTHLGLLLALPRIYTDVQFSYRLENYMLLGLSAAILVVLVLAKSASRPLRLWAWTLAPILVVSVVGAIQQTDAYPKGNLRLTAFSSYAEPPLSKKVWPDYVDVSLPYVPDRGGRPAEIDFPATTVHDNRASEVVHLRPGQLVTSNLAANPNLVHVSGARIVGIDQEYNDVLEIDPTASGRGGAQAETISVGTSESLPVVLGRLLSLGAVLFLVLELALLAIRRFR